MVQRSNPLPPVVWWGCGTAYVIYIYVYAYVYVYVYVYEYV